MIHHVSIRTRDLARAECFYRSLGFLPEVRTTNSRQQPLCWLLGRHGRIELTEVASDRAPCDAAADSLHVGYDHLALAVEDLDALLQSLEAAGAQLVLAATPRLLSGRSYRVAFIRDPEGLLIELIEDCGAAVEAPLP